MNVVEKLITENKIAEAIEFIADNTTRTLITGDYNKYIKDDILNIKSPSESQRDWNRLKQRILSCEFREIGELIVRKDKPQPKETVPEDYRIALIPQYQKEIGELIQYFKRRELSNDLREQLTACLSSLSMYNNGMIVNEMYDHEKTQWRTMSSNIQHTLANVKDVKYKLLLTEAQEGKELLVGKMTKEIVVNAYQIAASLGYHDNYAASIINLQQPTQSALNQIADQLEDFFNDAIKKFS